MNPQNQHEQEESQPLGQITYFNILARSIERINEAIMNEKDARDAAENLLSDLPDEWTEEIKDKIDDLTDKYNETIKECNKFMVIGIRQSLKEQAQREMIIAGKNYSRGIKTLAISLLKKKNLLYSVRNNIMSARTIMTEEAIDSMDEEP